MLCPENDYFDGFGIFNNIKIQRSPIQLGRAHYLRRAVCIESGQASVVDNSIEPTIKIKSRGDIYHHAFYQN